MELSSCRGVVLESDIGDTFDIGDAQTVELCFEVGLNGLGIEVGGGLYPEELSWAITFPSGVVETGGPGFVRKGPCVSPYPSPQPTATPMPTAPCELYMIELSDEFGDG